MTRKELIICCLYEFLFPFMKPYGTVVDVNSLFRSEHKEWFNPVMWTSDLISGVNFPSSHDDCLAKLPSRNCKNHTIRWYGPSVTPLAEGILCLTFRPHDIAN